MSMLMTTRLLQAPGPFVPCHIRCNNKRYYYPGDTVSGQVVVTPTETIYCHGMYVAFEGKAVVTFKTLGETRSKTEDICKLETYILGKNIPHAGMKKILVQPHEFNFSFELPLDLPSSFNGKLGVINFQVVVYLVRSDTYHVKQSEKTIKVRGTLDLHEFHPDSFRSVTYHAPTRRPPLTCTLQLNKGGFLPCVSKSAKATVAFINKSSMDEVTPTIWSGTIPVPKDLQPTQFGAPIEIIDLQYAIQIEVTGRDSALAKGEVPIIIGGFTKFTAPPQPDPETESGHSKQSSPSRRPASPGGSDEKDMDNVSTDRRGSASDLPNLSQAFSLLSFLPLSKSISMENLKNDARAAMKGKEA
ncbi:Arrestin domain-containing protein 5 [Orchesella cincta]|uniref:Arrestin domain-containing protein 5 n=1 Tax=Orchesella cincta TaxID=48709 RepID=A0A1D2NL23_ORCCI|nr:Arrestin domain-containing protein 5 [Orchesella cincta]